MVKHLSAHEYKNLRIHTINLCEKILNRQLKAFEKEILLFPRLCANPICREWRTELLNDCMECGQVSALILQKGCDARGWPDFQFSNFFY
jgi:hypothetical protein